MKNPAITITGSSAAASAMIVLFLATASAIAEPLVLDVIEAVPAHDARSDMQLVAFRLSEDSKKAFADFSLLNLGKQIDLRVEGKTINQTFIREPITGGALQIIVTSPDEARQLANRLIRKARLEVDTSP